jgi:hypothetical protein
MTDCCIPMKKPQEQEKTLTDEMVRGKRERQVVLRQVRQRREGDMAGVSVKQVVTLSLTMVALVGLLCTVAVYAGSPEEEAKKLVMNYFLNNKLVTRCNDRFFTHVVIVNPERESYWFIVEYKEVSPVIEQEQVIYADKLNSIEWKGSGSLTCKSQRGYFPREGWTSWKDCRGSIFDDAFAVGMLGLEDKKTFYLPMRKEKRKMRIVPSLF